MIVVDKNVEVQKGGGPAMVPPQKAARLVRARHGFRAFVLGVRDGPFLKLGADGNMRLNVT